MTAPRDALMEALDIRTRQVERLRAILDRPDVHDFFVASEIEARFQIDRWGTGDGFPVAFSGHDDAAFAWLIAYLTGKVVATPDEDVEKKLHRITTIAAAAANWHARVAMEAAVPAHREAG